MTKKSASPIVSARGAGAGRRALRRAALALTLPALWTCQAAAGGGGWSAERPGGSPAASRSAGLAAGGGFDGLWFSCKGAPPGTLRLLVARPGWRFDDAAERTVVASVDGTAYLFSAAPALRPEGGAMLASAAPLAAFAPLIAALAKGKAIEISTPLGRYTLPLKGSGKALAALKAGCGGGGG